jgi:hypothetical protein
MRHSIWLKLPTSHALSLGEIFVDQVKRSGELNSTERDIQATPFFSTIKLIRWLLRIAPVSPSRVDGSIEDQQGLSQFV